MIDLHVIERSGSGRLRSDYGPGKPSAHKAARHDHTKEGYADCDANDYQWVVRKLPLIDWCIRSSASTRPSEHTRINCAFYPPGRADVRSAAITPMSSACQFASPRPRGSGMAANAVQYALSVLRLCGFQGQLDHWWRLRLTAGAPPFDLDRDPNSSIGSDAISSRAAPKSLVATDSDSP